MQATGRAERDGQVRVGGAGRGVLRAAVGGGLAALLGVAACAPQIASGRAIYDTACAVCHGPSGLGDGPFAERLIRVPPDLTELAAGNGGTFPRARIAGAITGHDRIAGFSGAMPTFDAAPDDLMALIAYLETLQR